MPNTIQWGLGCLAWLLLTVLVLFGGFLVAFPVIAVAWSWPAWAWPAWLVALVLSLKTLASSLGAEEGNE